MNYEENVLETAEILLDEEQMPAIRQGVQKAEQGLGRRRYDVRSEMYGEWLAESDDERELRQLAEEYHASCEVYDRRVCNGISSRSGEVMPINPQELGLVNQNARDVRRNLMRRTRFTEDQVSNAIRKYYIGSRDKKIKGKGQ